MANVSATLRDAQLIEAPQSSSAAVARYTYRLNLTTGTMTAGDTASITNVPALLAAQFHQGRTMTLRQCMGGIAGETPGGTQAFALIATINTASIQFSVGNSAAAAAVASGTIVPMYVSLDVTAG